MKKLITIIIIGIVLNACEKKPFDYRNKFVGEYEFTTLIRETSVACCEAGNSCCLKETEVIFNGNVSYGKEGNEILIDYIEDKYAIYNNHELGVKDGQYKTTISVLGKFNYSNDGFSNDGLVNFFVFRRNGNVTHTVIGKKK